MAISLKTAGTWARMVTDGGTVAIPGSPSVGNRMYLAGSWKTYTITVTTPNGWNLVDDFSDGAVAAGNGTGSVHNAVYYRDWQSGDAAPAIDYSVAPTEGHWVIMLWQKDAGDTWGTPVAVHAAIAAADPWSATSSATITVPDASVVMSLIGLRDDSTTIARSTTTAISDDGSPTVTWNGNYVESPAAHFTSTTGNDMAGDLGHRFVTTGAAGVNLISTGDPVAAETGTVTWVVQGLVTPVTGTGAGTDAASTASGTAIQSFKASGAATGAASTASGTALARFIATGAGIGAASTAAGDGTVTTSGFTGTGAGISAASSSSGTALLRFLGTLAATDAASTASGQAVLAFAAAGAGADAASDALGSGLLRFLAEGAGISAPSSGGGIAGPEPEAERTLPVGRSPLYRMAIAAVSARARRGQLDKEWLDWWE